MINRWFSEAKEGMRDYAEMLQDLLFSVRKKVTR